MNDKFRSYRDRDPVAREAPEQFSRGALRDLLVELARLTGQGDPNVSRDGGSSGLWPLSRFAALSTRLYSRTSPSNRCRT